MKNAFENNQKTIEDKNIEESKKYFEKYMANTYLKEFEMEIEKKFEFKISLISNIKNFAEEFMNLCTKFINTFKSDTYKIIIEFDIKENNQIEHINFIVIGKTGVGKSTFINEALLLDENKRAKVGKGEPVTHESVLYSSDKLKMIRMWDTQGLDYNNTLESILNEITRLVKDGIDKGPDNYINIILYCTQGERFENGDGQLIDRITKLYPFDNLPVIITQLQSYFENRAIEMEGIIKKILNKYLQPQKADKIEIKSILSQDYKEKNITIKSYGIPELLRLSFDIMGRSICSATCRKISDDIKKLCTDSMDKKILYVENLFKYEMEMLEVAKNLIENNPEEEDDDNLDDEEKKKLSENNIYRNVENPNYFFDNFIKIISDKFITIFNNLENENIPLGGGENDNENIPQENDIEEHKEPENNNIEQNNINENINQDNNQNENENNLQDMQVEQNEEEEREKDEEENNHENVIQNENVENEIQNENAENEIQNENAENEIQNENAENENQNENAENEIKDKPEIVSLITKNLKKLRKILDKESNKIFEKIFNERFDIYHKELLDEQTEKNREYRDNTQLINKHEVEKNFQEKLFPLFKNEFFKISLCIILKLFMNNLKEILDMIVQKELKENENIINNRAENSLKNITEILKKKLIAELDNLMKEQK